MWKGRTKALLGKFPVPSTADFNPVRQLPPPPSLTISLISKPLRTVTAFLIESPDVSPSPLLLPSLAYRPTRFPRSCSFSPFFPSRGALSKRLIILLITSFFPVPGSLPSSPARYESTANPLKLVILEDFLSRDCVLGVPARRMFQIDMCTVSRNHWILQNTVEKIGSRFKRKITIEFIQLLGDQRICRIKSFAVTIALNRALPR